MDEPMAAGGPAGTVVAADGGSAPPSSKPGWFALEKQAPFSRSLIWQLQQRYFVERGIDAWRRGEVPHYVTSNPTIANAYAEIVLAFWRDRQRLVPQDQPLTIAELGAGSGRFAFHFLKRLESLCADAGVPPQAFRYVLTDAAGANLAFWHDHPCFAPYVADGRLDLAQFDVVAPTPLALQASGEVVGPRSLAHPPVVIANYLFDSVPQDLFHVRNQRLHVCRVSLAVDTEPEALDIAELLDRVQVHYDEEETAAPYEEAWLQQLVSCYQQQLRDAHVLLPAAGLRCIRSLAGLSAHGAMVLSADKGHHRLSELEGLAAPGLVRHGSFSLSVNYHAFAQACTDAGGLALVPADHHASIDIVGLLWLGGASAHGETQSAYRRHVQEFGPDSFYRITKHARPTIPAMAVEDILAYLRLGRYDSHQCGRYLPRLLELVPAMDTAARLDVVAAVERVWDMYFPLGEDLDLANGIAGLLYAMDEYAAALDYFERSMAVYGVDTGTLYNIAACHHLLGNHGVAAAVLRKALDYEPANDAMRGLLLECEAASEAAAPARGGEGG